MDAEIKAEFETIRATLTTLAEAQAISAKVILSSEEAIIAAGFKSQAAFSRWCTTWGVTNSGPGRWPHHRIKAGLEKEARSQTRLRTRHAA